MEVLTDSDLNKLSCLLNALFSSSKLISPESSVSVSRNSAAARSSTVSSLSSDGASSRQHLSIMRISS
ncbi:hypothetical protein BpHYR1_053182 [Brachionus plicatilis]|uniref:Uncharacterized protein n=1 Tax=Brachionus plicatilis TaxID=10195 RepID=A0A3M7S2E7_BRAPC|nr:hypothetical protein BpHYR1_053182 [Brachionus plicatilis]